ncbi:MAG: hypothetical protein K6E83_11080 [Clostridium sp.]|nr:hypothetical protein [Clostridium sp.]
MSTKLLDPGPVAREIKESCRLEAGHLREAGIIPRLAIVRVGEKGPDLSYEKGAKKVMEETGIETVSFAWDAGISQEEYIRRFRDLNRDPAIHGILPLRPLDHIDENAAISANLSPEKDVDGGTPANIGRILLGDEKGLFPCTAAAILAIMDYYADAVRWVRKNNSPFNAGNTGDVCRGLDVCIVNNSNVIGKPLLMMLTNRYATVSMVHHLSAEEDKRWIASRADVLIAATPVRNTVTADMVKPGAFVVDASVIREKLWDPAGYPILDEKTGKQKTGIFGCCTEEARQKAAYITPVRGMGAVTSAMLAKNVIRACRLQTSETGKH